MEPREPWRITLELLLFAALLGTANVLTGVEPGFVGTAVNPYMLLTFLVAAAYGKYWSFAALALCTAVAALPVPVLQRLLGRGPATTLTDLATRSALPLSATLAGGYILGIIRDAHYAKARRMREKTRMETRDMALLEREIDAIQAINAELEERVSRQQDSLTYLYTRIQSLYTLNLDRGFQTILETVSRFSGATSCSVWEHRASDRDLVLAGSRGWEEDTTLRATLPAEGTIEGWVVRNNLPFSVRMLLLYENLQSMDRGRNLITLPIPVGRRIWGVLNIEEMPFEKYNQYTEKLLQMLVALSAPAIERALEYASAAGTSDANEVTGLPSFGTFHRVLERTVQHAIVEKTGLCVVVFEIANQAALLETFDARAIHGLYPLLAGTMVSLSNNRASVYHYREDSQLVVLYPHLDTDGAVLYGLDVLEGVNAAGWTIAGRPAPLEIILGYAALDRERQTADDLLRAAERLLEMQRL